MKRALVFLTFLLGVLSTSPVVGSSYDDMLQAIKADERETVEHLLSLGFDPNAVDPDGNGLLHIAAREGYAEAIEVLLAYRADMNRLNRFGETPLMLAALRGHEEIVDIFLTKNASLKGENWTPLLYAAYGGHEAIAKKLLERGASVDETSGNGSTPLMMAAHAGAEELVELLLKRGANPLVKNLQERTAADWAADNGNTDVAERITQAIEQLNTLFTAATTGDTERARQLLDAGVNPNLTDQNGQSPLLMAAQNGHLDMIRLLLARGARVEQTNREGETAVMLAAYNGHLPALNYLVSQGALFQQSAGMDALSYAALNCQADALQSMLANGARPEHALEDGTTLLLLATRSDCEAAVKLLLEKGASPLTPNILEETPFESARIMESETLESLMAEAILKRFVAEWFAALAKPTELDYLLAHLSEQGLSLKIQGKTLRSTKDIQRWHRKLHNNMELQDFQVTRSVIGKKQDGLYPVHVEVQWRGLELKKEPRQRELSIDMLAHLEKDGKVKLRLYQETVLEPVAQKEIKETPIPSGENIHGIDQLP